MTADLRTDWADGAGQVEDAAFLNQVGVLVNANTHSRTQFGTLAGRPAANAVTAGCLYFCSDNNTLYRSDGSVWIKVRIGADSCPAMGDVPTTGWTAVNMQTGASWVADKDAMLFTIPSTTGSPIQYQYRAYPTPPFTLTVHMQSSLTAIVPLTNNTGLEAGIILSDGTKLIIFGQGVGYNTATLPMPFPTVSVIKMTNVTTVSGTVKNWASSSFEQTPRWFRVTDDGTTVSYIVSYNGIDWTTIFAEPRTAFLSPSRIGIGGGNNFGASWLRVSSWNGI